MGTIFISVGLIFLVMTKVAYGNRDKMYMNDEDTDSSSTHKDPHTKQGDVFLMIGMFMIFIGIVINFL